MHKIIFEEFAEQTIVAVMHRQQELNRFDTVVELDKGRIVRTVSVAGLEG